jgi:predicted alpha/beta hydrolase
MTLHEAPPVAGAEGVDPLRIAAEGAVLAGLLYRPAGAARALVVLNGALGVPQRFYRSFAQWLAGQGLACMTYDYREFGASATRPARASRATLADWGLRDQPAAMAAARGLVPDVPVWVIGHSFGGMMLPFNGQAQRAARVITLGSGMVRLRDHPWPYRLAAASFWHAHGPALVAAFGYLPGRLSRLGPDLPPGVYWDWRRWALSGGQVAGAQAARGAISAPMKVIAVADDPMMPPCAVWRLMALAPDAVKRQRVLRPGDFGLRTIGHFGAFARQNSVVWPAIIA